MRPVAARGDRALSPVGPGAGPATQPPGRAGPQRGESGTWAALTCVPGRGGEGRGRLRLPPGGYGLSPLSLFTAVAILGGKDFPAEVGGAGWRKRSRVAEAGPGLDREEAGEEGPGPPGRGSGCGVRSPGAYPRGQRLSRHPAPPSVLLPSTSLCWRRRGAGPATGWVSVGPAQRRRPFAATGVSRLEPSIPGGKPESRRGPGRSRLPADRAGAGRVVFLAEGKEIPARAYLQDGGSSSPPAEEAGELKRETLKSRPAPRECLLATTPQEPRSRN